MCGKPFFPPRVPFVRVFGPLSPSKPSARGPSGPVSCLRPPLVDGGVAKAPLQRPKCTISCNKNNDFAKSPFRQKVLSRALLGPYLAPSGGSNGPTCPPCGSPRGVVGTHWVTKAPPNLPQNHLWPAQVAKRKCMFHCSKTDNSAPGRARANAWQGFLVSEGSLCLLLRPPLAVEALFSESLGSRLVSSASPRRLWGRQEGPPGVKMYHFIQYKQ